MRPISITRYVAFAISIAAAGASYADVSVSAIDNMVKEEIARRHIPSASVAVVKDGKVVLEKGYGFANIELSTPATASTVYEIGSITKQFTATAIMMLMEDGKLALDDPASKYIEGLPDDWSSVTIRHLLTHTSGIKSYTNLPSFITNLRKDYSEAEVLKLSYDSPLEFKPGDKMNYNNTGYFMLGMIIEKTSGQSYGDFLRDKIFSPLGMTSTRVNNFSDVIPNRASGYEWKNGTYKNAEYLSMTQPGAAGVLVSTVQDMVKWDAALNSGRLLKRSSQEMMWEPYKLSSGVESNYGFGWGISNVPGHRSVAHGGGIPGFTTEIRRLLDDKLTVVIFTNSGNGQPAAIAQRIADAYVPSLKPKPVKTVFTKDPDPKLTERLKGLFAEALAGKIDKSAFSPKMQEVLSGPDVAGSRKELNGMGNLKSFEFISQSGDEKRRALLYKATLGKTAVEVSIALDEQGTIVGMGVRPSD